MALIRGIPGIGADINGSWPAEYFRVLRGITLDKYDPISLPPVQQEVKQEEHHGHVRSMEAVLLSNPGRVT